MDLGIAPTPKGPTGKRASMMNGLADSITKRREEQAGRREVGRLSSPRTSARTTVGKDGIVFPATPTGTAAAIAAHRENGLDVSAFTQHVEDGTTFPFPVTDHAADINAHA